MFCVIFVILLSHTSELRCEINMFIQITCIRGESKKFVDFVNKIKSTYAISLKLPYVCDQFNTNKHRKFQTNRLINVVSMAICLMRVSATRSTPRR